MIRAQFSLDLNDELIVDNFAGGGGASTGIELALGRHVDIAVNHDPEAVAMHQANHPQTQHLCESVFDVDPVQVTAGRPVGLAWFSPDCKHFSKAKGGKPRDKKIRGLALVVLEWVRRLRTVQGSGPRVIMLENVEEFQTWGPLLPDGALNPACKGATFRAFVGALRRRGYAVEWRELRACDYGAPTIRKRLFLIARCDGQPIVWPVPTHGDPKSEAVRSGERQPWRTAAECIDWRIPCPSIFERKRPLAPATCRRIAKGIMRYVVNCAEPFIVPLTHHGESDRVTTMGQPLPTVTAAHRGELALVAPALVVNTTNHTGGRADEPVKTKCAGGTHHMLVAPVLTEHANAKHERTFDPQAPLRTQCAEVKGGHFALVGAFLAKHYGGVVGSKLPEPIGTVTGVDHHSLVSAHLTKFRTGNTGSAAGELLHTVTAGPKENPAGAAHALGLVTSHLTKLRGTSTAQGTGEPLHTVSAKGTHFGEVRAFLVKYYGKEKEPLGVRGPLHTVTSKDHFGLVTVNGAEYAITDIGLRMLAPRELFRAQGFPESYRIGDAPGEAWRLTKSAQVRMCGNSVCPPLAEALVRANVPELRAWTRGETRRKERVA